MRGIQSSSMKPQDVVLLLKLVSIGHEHWSQKDVADQLGMSQSEISQSVARSRFAGLLDHGGKKVMRSALMDFLEGGLRYVFPQRPGAMVRGVPTSHSAPPLDAEIRSSESYVWPYATGKVRGQAILPLYPSVPEAATRDPLLHELLSLTDALRVGRARERELALSELRKRIGVEK